MTTLHTFGCSITQGFALPDVVRTLRDDSGQPLNAEAVDALNLHWTDLHICEPSVYAWPSVLAQKLNIPHYNYARRGACFQQIARQCVVNLKNISSDDVVIVMWTYLSRLSLQWPARTSVPFANLSTPKLNWRTTVLGFNKLFGLSPAKDSTLELDESIQSYIESSTKNTYLDPLGTYNRYYNSLVLQSTVDGMLRSTGARVIHLSVEPESVLSQLELARADLDLSLQAYTEIPDPKDWYTVEVDNKSCLVILDPSIPKAENDMHPSVRHHKNFAAAVYQRYFQNAAS